MSRSVFYCIENNEDGRPRSFYDESSKTWFTPTFLSRNEAVKFAITHGIECDEFETTSIKLVRY